jgi:hypothetical protein
MPPSEQLVWRALRLLTDDYRHSIAAIAWANRTVRMNCGTALQLLQQGFTPREISLGAGAW